MSVESKTLKETLPLEDYIKTHYPDERITRKGAASFICCPVHADSNPSCQLNQYSFKCYSCGASGSVIDYVAHKEGMNLPEDFLNACEVVAGQLGIPFDTTPPNPHFEAYKDELDELNQRYWAQLKEHTEAVAYLTQERGLTAKTIRAFRLGVTAPNEHEIRGRGFISNRLVFPILEMRTPSLTRKVKCIGMGYRKLDKDSDEPKYVNDPNQDGQNGRDPNVAGVFLKSDVLYGYSHAVDAIKKKRYAIVVEGYMDVLSLHQSGYKNTVACMGTALTTAQMIKLRKLTQHLILFFDADRAGEQNTLRVLPELLAHGFHVKIVRLRSNEDPADICLKYDFSYERVGAVIRDHSISAVDHIINESCQSFESMLNQERLRALKQAMPFISAIPDPIERQVYEAALHERLRLK